MDLWDILIRLMIVGCIILVVISIIMTGYSAFYQEYTTNGQVSSTHYSDNILYKANCVEYYGGQKNCFFANASINQVKANIVCEVKTHGLFLDSIRCEK